MRLLPLMLIYLFLLSSVSLQAAVRGYIFRDLSTGRDLLSSNPDKPLTPASTAKLVTTYLALRRLSPYTRFSLRLLRRGDTYALLSDWPWLIEEYTGDPAGYLRELLANVPDGSTLIVVTGEFPMWNSYWNEGDKLQVYAPLTSQLAFNENSFKVVVTISRSRAMLKELYPDLPSVEVVNWLRVYGSTESYWDGVAEASGEGWRLILRGYVSASEGQSVSWAPVDDPVKFNVDVMNKLLSDMGRRVKVRASAELPEGDWSLVKALSSPPLISLLRHQMYISDNFIAENLLRYMTFLELGEVSQEAEERFLSLSLRELKVKFKLIGDPSVLHDGCGLSTQNKLTPIFLTALLEDLYNSPLLPYLLEVLPREGEGTLSKRFKGLGCHVIAKTGTLQDVSALAGYLNKGNRWIVFAIMSEGEYMRLSKRYEEKLIRKVCDGLLR